MRLVIRMNILQLVCRKEEEKKGKGACMVEVGTQDFVIQALVQEALMKRQLLLLTSRTFVAVLYGPFFFSGI